MNIKAEQKDNLFSFLKKKGKLKNFKEISVKEFMEFVNAEISNGLVVGNKYNYGGYDSVHKQIKGNIIGAIHKLFIKYEVDYSELFDYISMTTWHIGFDISYKSISIWENVFRYDFKGSGRKNANITNDEFVLKEIPYVYIENEDYKDFVNLSMYDMIIQLLKIQKEKDTNRYKGEIASLKRQIKDYERKIKEEESVKL